MQNVHFTPPEIARLLGVNVSTVKRWIDKGIMESHKTSGGHRRIDRDQLTTFVHSYRDGAQRSYILKRLSEQSDPNPSDEYFSDLYEARYAAARDRIIQSYVAGTSVSHIVERVMVPTLRRIGEGWIGGTIDIADEHRMSFVIRQHAAMLSSYLPDPDPTRGHYVLACVPGENHELNLELLSLMLRANGAYAEVLGINIPAGEIVRHLDQHPVTALVLAKVYASKKSLRAFLTTVGKEARARATRLIVGGGGWKPVEIALLKRLQPSTLQALSFSEVIRGICSASDMRCEPLYRE